MEWRSTGGGSSFGGLSPSWRGERRSRCSPRPDNPRCAGVHCSRAGGRADRGDDARSPDRRARSVAREVGALARDARRHREQRAGCVPAGVSSEAGRPEEAAVPPRGRGDGRDARLQSRRALPPGSQGHRLSRDAQQHHEPRAVAHGARAVVRRGRSRSAGAGDCRGRSAERSRRLGRGGEGVRARQCPDGGCDSPAAGGAAGDCRPHLAAGTRRAARGDAAAARGSRPAVARARSRLRPARSGFRWAIPCRARGPTRRWCWRRT